MAMAVDDGGKRQFRQLEVARVLVEELAEQQSLLTKASGKGLIRKQMWQHVAEDHDATRLEPHNWSARFEVRAQHLQRLQQYPLRQTEHAVVVEWATATEIAVGNNDLIPRGFEYLDGCATDLGV